MFKKYYLAWTIFEFEFSRFHNAFIINERIFLSIFSKKKNLFEPRIISLSFFSSVFL